jgi:hypothetical protein
MHITDQRTATPAPPATPPSFVRRHPIVAGFGVLSGLSLFSALWPASAIAITLAIAAHATGVDRVAWSLTRKAAMRIFDSVRGRSIGTAPSPEPSPDSPQPPAPHLPDPAAGRAAPRREVRAPATGGPRPRRRPPARRPEPSASMGARRPGTPDGPVGRGIDGPGV